LTVGVDNKWLPVESLQNSGILYQERVVGELTLLEEESVLSGVQESYNVFSLVVLVEGIGFEYALYFITKPITYFLVEETLIS